MTEKKKPKKSTKAAAKKIAQALYDELATQHELARMDAVIYGIGMIAIDPEGSMRHVSLPEILRMAGGR